MPGLVLLSVARRRALSAPRRCARCGALSALRGRLRHRGRRLTLSAGCMRLAERVFNRRCGLGWLAEARRRRGLQIDARRRGRRLPELRDRDIRKTARARGRRLRVEDGVAIQVQCVTPAIVLSPRWSSSTCDVDGSR